jgi:hypothetical protein
MAKLGNHRDNLYAALRKQAKLRGRSMAHVCTAQVLKRRRQLLQQALRMSARRASTSAPFPSTEEMLRDDRAR